MKMRWLANLSEYLIQGGLAVLFILVNIIYRLITVFSYLILQTYTIEPIQNIVNAANANDNGNLRCRIAEFKIKKVRDLEFARIAVSDRHWFSITALCSLTCRRVRLPLWVILE